MILAIDYGSRYVGLASTDPEGRLALRHSVIDQQHQDVFNALTKLINQERVAKILVGVPVSLDGEITDQTHVSLAFIEKLQACVGEAVEVISVDETLTSVEAEASVARDGVAKDEAHAEAARIMLAEYLRNSNE
jgi:putative transcription antitermination factor YqgF